MSQRMTDEEVRAARGRIGVRRGLRELDALDAERDRARSEEARLLERVAELEAKLERAHRTIANGAGAAIAREQGKVIVAQAEQIKALADALGGTNGLGHTPSRSLGEVRLSCDRCAHFAPSHAAFCVVGAALRLVGRL